MFKSSRQFYFEKPLTSMNLNSKINSETIHSVKNLRQPYYGDCVGTYTYPKFIQIQP